MSEQYLKALIDGLHQKIAILDKLTEYTSKQQSIVSQPEVDWDQFDKTIDDKDELIQKLVAADEGFQAIYDRVKDDVSANKDKYKQYISEMQRLIGIVTEKSTSLMALEQRTKVKVANGFGTQRQKVNRTKASSKVANSYYNSMNKMNYIDPQLMDTKK